MECQGDSHKATETSGTLMRLGFDWRAPFLVQGKRVEPRRSLWSAVHEFSFSKPQREWGVGERTSCSFIKGSDNNCINLIFPSHLPEEKRICNSLGDSRFYKIFRGLTETCKSQGSCCFRSQGHLHPIPSFIT